jgi:hypothetical protein
VTTTTRRTTAIQKTDLAGSTLRFREPAEADLATLPVAAQDGPLQRAIAEWTLAFAPVTRAVPGLRLGIRAGGRMSPTRLTR